MAHSFWTLIAGAAVTFIAGYVGSRYILRQISKCFSASYIIKLLLTSPLSFDGFDVVLNIPNCVDRSSVLYNDGEVSFKYRIPKSICCFPTLDGKSYLTICGVLALVDQVTSILTMACDQSHRIGVSVNLSGEVLDPCNNVHLECGKEVIVKARVQKIGLTLAFLSMSLHSTSEESRVLASCSHIKYLKTSVIYDNFLGYLVPLLVYLVKLFFPTINRSCEKKIKVAAERARDDWSLYHDTAASKNDDVDVSEYFPLKPSKPNVYELVIHPLIRNYFNVLHGGAAVCAVYRSAQLSCPNAKFQPRCMSVQFLSPCKGNVQLFVRPVAEGDKLNCSLCINVTSSKHTQTKSLIIGNIIF